MFEPEQSWNMDEPQKVLALIKVVKVWRLANWDGCVCSRFSIRNVDVDISCGKGRARGVWVSSPSCDYWDGKSADGNYEAMLRPIAEEIVSQIDDGRGHMPIQFREWDKVKDTR